MLVFGHTESTCVERSGHKTRTYVIGTSQGCFCYLAILDLIKHNCNNIFLFSLTQTPTPSNNESKAIYKYPLYQWGGKSDISMIKAI